MATVWVMICLAGALLIATATVAVVGIKLEFEVRCEDGARDRCAATHCACARWAAGGGKRRIPPPARPLRRGPVDDA